MVILISLIPVFIIILSFIRFKLGLIIYIFYSFIVPFLNVDIFGVNFQYNLVNLLFLVSFFYNAKSNNYKISFAPMLPFILLYGTLFLMIPFQSDVPVSVQLNSFRSNIMMYFIIPFILWNTIVNDNSYLIKIRKLVIIIIAIATLYGLFLTIIPGINPYLISLLAINGMEFNADYASSDTGRLFGRISSVFLHPMTFALFLILSFIYIYSIRKKINLVICYGLLVIIGVNVFTCGVRTVLASMGIITIYFLFCIRKFKIIAISLLLLGIVFMIVKSNPLLDGYVDSIINKDQSEVKGSSLDMRISQFDGCLEEISGSPMVGKGYNWTNYYIQKRSRFNGFTGLVDAGHPKILHFESLIFIVLCNWGYLGILMWIYFIYRIVKITRKFCREDRILMDTLLLGYLAFSVITGEYGYMQYFSFFFILLYAENKIKLLKNENK